jgi:hypothetical protein
LLHWEKRDIPLVTGPQLAPQHEELADRTLPPGKAHKASAGSTVDIPANARYVFKNN